MCHKSSWKTDLNFKSEQIEMTEQMRQRFCSDRLSLARKKEIKESRKKERKKDNLYETCCRGDMSMKFHDLMFR